MGFRNQGQSGDIMRPGGLTVHVAVRKVHSLCVTKGPPPQSERGAQSGREQATSPGCQAPLGERGDGGTQKRSKRPPLLVTLCLGTKQHRRVRACVVCV